MTQYKNTGIKQQVINEICDIAKACDIAKVLLFGSRARGDYKERSDIDLAVAGGKVELFAITVYEETSTLLKYDVVNLVAAIQDELLETIQKEGVIIYEKV